MQLTLIIAKHSASKLVPLPWTYSAWGFAEFQMKSSCLFKIYDKFLEPYQIQTIRFIPHTTHVISMLLRVAAFMRWSFSKSPCRIHRNLKRRSYCTIHTGACKISSISKKLSPVVKWHVACTNRWTYVLSTQLAWLMFLLNKSVKYHCMELSWVIDDLFGGTFLFVKWLWRLWIEHLCVSKMETTYQLRSASASTKGDTKENHTLAQTGY